jgi:hypothetical protein
MSKNNWRALRMGAAFAVVAWAAPVQAGTASRELSVAATVVSSRALRSTTSIAFYPDLVVVTITF